MRFLRSKSLEPESLPSIPVSGASMSDSDARRFTLLRLYCGASAIAAVGMGCLVLLGWEFHIEFLMSVFRRSSL